MNFWIAWSLPGRVVRRSGIRERRAQRATTTCCWGEIARLIAQGMSNRAIAEALFISPRTVDGHVERILAKLDFTSRTQVATWVAGNAAPGSGG